MAGKTVIVTGASSGIGLASARALAGAGARVVFAVRDVEKGRAAASATPGKTEVRALDLARLDSVRSFAAGWNDPVDILINNAAPPPPRQRRLTADGFELEFGTGHLGHFALTNLLIGRVTGRVVTLSSQAERLGRLDFDDLGLDNGYSARRAYARVKLANILFSTELQRRLEVSGSSVRANAAHPGLVVTPIYAQSGFITRTMVRLLGQSAEDGALPVLYAAAGDIPGDSFTGPSRFMHMRGAPELLGRSATARDAEVARRLWAVSERLTGVTWPLRSGQPVTEPASAKPDLP